MGGLGGSAAGGTSAGEGESGGVVSDKSGKNIEGGAMELLLEDDIISGGGNLHRGRQGSMPLGGWG